ncbi:MAG: hypothetical protein JXR68_02875 [Bacteroidales bacterium]|nr:hypothetical protein [Bacteroidales bacterium]
MKKTIITIIAAFVIFSFLPNKAEAQCRQQMVYTCATKGQSIYLRDFNTKLKNTSTNDAGTRWTVVLNKDAHYRFNLCTPDGFENKVILTLYDSQHPEKTSPYGSTFNATTGDHYEQFDFICKKSGMYYVSIRFKDGVTDKKTCAVGIMSFVGSN